VDFRNRELEKAVHIARRILNDIQGELGKRYMIRMSDRDWELFTVPLAKVNGVIDKTEFEERQQKSLDIMNRILGHHGKSKIVVFLGELASIEPQIQELQPWVRDHVVHAINTFLLGVFILKHCDFPTSISACYDYPFMWKLCGPTHDIGYPIEIARNIANPYVDALNGFFREMASTSPMIERNPYLTNLNLLCNQVDSNCLIQQRINEWGLGIIIGDYYAWLASNGKTDHGVISALVQLKIIDSLYQKYNSNREEKSIEEEGLDWNQKNFSLDIVSASTALFVHNIDLNYHGFAEKIDCRKAPLAFLLFLSDTFQEWDRYAEKKPVYSGEEFNISCDNHSISLVVPEEIEGKISDAISQRLEGFVIKINDNNVVS